MKASYILLLILMANVSIAQDITSFKGRIKVTTAKTVTRIDKVPVNVNVPANTGYVEVKYTKGDVEYTARVIDPTAGNAPVVVNKEVTMPVAGKANLYADKDDPTIIHVNYWLSSNINIPVGYTLQIDSSYWPTPSATVMTTSTLRTYTVTNATAYRDRNFSLAKVSVGSPDLSYEWYLNSPKKITVRDISGNIVYYLADKYVNNCDYQIKLKNRGATWFPALSYDLGAVTIPFKIRPGFTKNNIKVPTDVSADFNLGLFGGVSVGSNRYRSEKDGLKTLPEVKATFGAFFSFGKQDLDSLSTNGTDSPYPDGQKRSMLFASVGAGAMLSFANVKAGIFVGTDLGIGSEAKSWNFHKKPWIGFGLGYNIAGLWAKK